MKKIVFLVLWILFLGTFVSAQSDSKQVDPETQKKLDTFSALRLLSKESPKEYTSLEENAMKYIFLDTFEENADQYRSLFGLRESMDMVQSQRELIRESHHPFTLDNRTPAQSLLPFLSVLTRASFDYDVSLSQRWELLEAIDRKIQREQRRRVSYKQVDSYEFIEPEELYKMDIYRNGKMVNIGDIKDEIVYKKANTMYGYTLEYAKPYLTYDEAMKQIEENAKKGNKITPKKKDYEALIGDVEVPEIPAIFENIPSNFAVLYVKNPKNLVKILDTKFTSLGSLIWYEPGKFLKDMIEEYFWLDDIKDFSENMKHPFALVIDTVDITRPDISIILSDKDANFVNMIKFAPALKNKTINTKGGFTYITNSPQQYKTLVGEGKTPLSKASDFRFVWQKKAHKIQDIFMFAGDEFFESMLQFDTYISLKRKLDAVRQLRYLQWLAFSYKMAFGVNAQSIDELVDPFKALGKEISKDALHDFSIKNAIVTHNTIGELRNISYMSNIDFDLQKISRAEIESYQESVLGYREVWQAYLDPVGIIINAGDTKVDFDFYMTPIPEIRDIDFLKWLETVGKQNIDFITNEKIRIWNASVVFAFDVDKFKAIVSDLKDTDEIKYLLRSASRFLLGNESIFDYIDGEFALSVGDFDPSIFDGYNLDVLDASLAIKFKSDDKAKEFLQKIVAYITKRKARIPMWEKITDLLAKPLIKEYKWQTIYYVEDILGENGVYYWIFDSFLFISVNERTIQKIIDFYENPDLQKQKFAKIIKEKPNSFLTFLFDGKKVNKNLKTLFDAKAKEFAKWWVPFTNERIDTKIGSLKNQQKREEMYGEEKTKIDFTEYGVHFFEKDGKVYGKPVKKELQHISREKILDDFDPEDRKEITDALESDEFKTFVSQGLEYSSENDDIYALVFFDFFIEWMDTHSQFFKNFVFSLGMWDDEIFYSMAFFDDKQNDSNIIAKAQEWFNSITKQSSSYLFILIWGILVLIVWWFAWYMFSRRWSSSLSQE